MSLKKLALISAVSTLAVSCATQPPAPVYGGRVGARVPVPYPPVVEPVPRAPEPPPVVKTAPLKDYRPKVEPLERVYSKPPEIKVHPLPDGEYNSSIPTAPELELPSSETRPEPPPPTDKPAPEPETPVVTAPEPAPEPVIERHTPMPFEPFESAAPASPAVGALLADASQNSQSGNLDQAVTTIERAIRIEPRNANLYYKLAVIRLKQSKPRLAEDLAKKSAVLASSDKQLRKHSWLLIAKARDTQGNYDGAKEARNKADSF